MNERYFTEFGWKWGWVRGHPVSHVAANYAARILPLVEDGERLRRAACGMRPQRRRLMTTTEYAAYVKHHWADDGETLLAIPSCHRCAMMVDAVEASR